MKKEMKIIYKVTNIETNEVYIGATTRSIQERKIDHEKKSQKKSGFYFHEAIATHGADVFKWEQIDTASSNDELASKEIRYILENNSLENGYNSDKGGGLDMQIKAAV